MQKHKNIQKKNYYLFFFYLTILPALYNMIME